MAKVVSRIDDSWRRYLDSLGANAAFVEGLIRQYLENPAQVDERWRRTFDAVVAGNKVDGAQLKTAKSFPPQTLPHVEEPQPVAPTQSPSERVVPIRGAAAKI